MSDLTLGIMIGASIVILLVIILIKLTPDECVSVKDEAGYLKRLTNSASSLSGVKYTNADGEVLNVNEVQSILRKQLNDEVVRGFENDKA